MKKPQPAIGQVPVCEVCNVKLIGYHLILSQSNGAPFSLFCSDDCLRSFVAVPPPVDETAEQLPVIE